MTDAWPHLTHMEYNHDEGVLTIKREDGEWVAFHCLLRNAEDLRGLLGIPLRERKQGAWLGKPQPEWLPDAQH